MLNPNLDSGSALVAEETRIDFRTYVLFFQRRWKVIAITAVIIFLIIAGRTYRQKPIYESSTKLIVSTKSGGSDSGSGEGLLSDLESLKQVRNVETQVEILNNPDLLAAAFDRLDSPVYVPDTEKEYPITSAENTPADEKTDADLFSKASEFDSETSPRGQTSSKSPAESSTSGSDISSRRLKSPQQDRNLEHDQLGGFGAVGVPPAWSYDIKSKQDTDVITITCRSYNKDYAAAFANQIAEVYKEQDLSRNRYATNRGLQYVKSQILSLQGVVKGEATDLSRFQKQTNLVAASDQVSAVAASEIDLETQASEAQNLSTAAHDRLNSLGTELSKSKPFIVGQNVFSENPEYLNLQSQILQLEGQLTEQEQEFKPTAPEIQDLKSELADREARFRGITRQILQSKTTEANPLRLKLLGDYAEARANVAIASNHQAAVNALLERVKKQIAKFPDQERKLAELQERVDISTRALNLLSDKYYQLRVQQQSTVNNIITAGYARPNGSPASPKIVLNLLLGAFLAVFLGLAVGAFADQIDTRIHTPEEAERLTGLSVLAFVPEASSSSGSVVIGKVEPAHTFLESFRLLRNNLEFASPDHPIKTLSVTSSSPSEGKSTVAMNLAIAMAMDGKKVLLIDVDLRRPSVHKVLGVANKIGVTSVAQGKITFNEAVHSTDWENLFVLTSGPLPPEPTEFLNSEKMRLLMEELGAQFELIVLDAPPASGISDIQVISKFADAILMVASVMTTQKNLLQNSLKMLRKAGARIPGLVINRTSKDLTGYYGYYGYYGDSQNSETKRRG